VTAAALPAETALNEPDALYLRRAIELSAQAGARGNRPFGAVVVSAGGALLGEAPNDTFDTADCTGHAELRAISAASRAHPRAAFAGATVYASGEPCVMCAGAIFWSGARRVVFGIDAVRLRDFRRLRAGSGDLEWSCREIFARSPEPIETLGPALLDEASAPHAAFWSAPGR